jgi:filamentous hemagglutinin
MSNNGITAYEVKNYNIATNMNSLIRNVANQAIYRAAHLPPGSQQRFIIDIRGQEVTFEQKNAIRQYINQRSGGIIMRDQVQFIGDGGLIE